MYKRTVLIFSCFLTAFGLRAQTTQTLTLPQALELGVKNSKQLVVSENKVKEAQAKVAKASDAAWPELSVSASYLRINTPNISMPSSDASSGGGTSPLAGFSNIHNIGLAQASLSIPLFSGFQIHNNKLMADYLAQASRYDNETAQGKVKLNTAKAFYQLYELQETKKVVEENLKQEQQRIVELKNLEQQQLLARNDRLKAELQANQIELSLLEINGNIQLAQYNLTLLLGLPSETLIQVDTTGMMSASSLQDWDIYLQKGLENRSELKAAAYQVKAGESNYKISKAKRYPSLSLTGGYINAYIPDFITVTNALNAGVSFKYSITGAIHAGHSMQEANARYKQAEASQQLTTDQASVEIRQKYLSYKLSLEKETVRKRAIEQAQENFDINQNKYKQGLLLLSDYLDADLLLLQARINHATAKTDSMIAYYELQESIGNLQ